MSTSTFIVWHDTLSSHSTQVECLSYEQPGGSKNVPPLAAADFVVIQDQDQGQQWMAQVIEPQRNVPLQGLTRESPSGVAVFERILRGEIDKSIFLNQVYYYRLQLIGEITENGRLTAVRRRPRAGSTGRIALPAEVRRALDLPAVEVQNTNVIGRIHGTAIPIAVDWAALRQHVLVTGATGAGKSNSVANLIKAAQSFGACVVVYDQKPDYQHMQQANDEKKLFDKWSSDVISARGLENVNRYCLYQGPNEQEEGETAIAVRAQDVSLTMLANALFHYPDEGLQRENFTSLVSYYKDRVQRDWTLASFASWLQKTRSEKALDQIASSQGWGSLNDKVIDAVQRKMTQRKPRWIDSLNNAQPSHVGRTGVLASVRNGNTARETPTGYFIPKESLASGRILVIRTNAEGREYGLFLSYMLREIFKLRQKNEIGFPVVNIVDEAQDIFQGESGVRESATARMNEIIRKGRSKDIGFVIAVQSVSQVPEAVLTNMNSRIIHRQNSLEELRLAIPSASRDLMATSLTFGPGEALVSLIGARSVVQAEMAPSPFELSKTSAMARKTLADQDDEAEKRSSSLGEPAVEASTENEPFVDDVSDEDIPF